MTRVIQRAVLAIAVLLLLAAPAAARPGGGHSFSGGGHSFSSGRSSSGYHGSGYHGHGGHGSGSLAGLIVLIAIIVILAYLARRRGVNGIGGLIALFARGGNLGSVLGDDMGQRAPPVDLGPLRATDPHFSRLLLEDFLQALYARAHYARADAAQLAALAPYLSQPARSALASRGNRQPGQVTGVVVGALRLDSLTAQPDRFQLKVDIEANYSERSQPGERATGYFAKESWFLSRRAGVQSRSPERIDLFDCPNCRAPVTASQDERCQHCGTVFGSGEFDWFVDAIALLGEQRQGSLLTGNVHEVHGGPTVREPDLEQQLAALSARDPQFDVQGFYARVNLIYNELNQAWSNLRWDLVRPYTSDRFWMSQQYWIDAYREEGLQNVLKDATVTGMEIAKVTSDPYYDAITVRVFATAKDFTVEQSSGKVVGGSARSNRTYSEYWTLIRSSGTTGAASADKKCPNCGAELAISMAGNCEYCEAKVTSGQFDWVLSRIEQDEVYAG